MARVNHKKVKQMLEETRKKITDRQFFTSRILAGHYEDMAAAQTRRYKYNRRIKMRIIWKPRDQSIAVTNNLKILINAGHPIVTKRNRLRQERYMIVTGLFAHELGHALFTDFLASQTYTNFLAAYKWYPAPPAFKSSADVRREKSLWEYAKRDQSSLEALQYLAHHIWNIIEDGYIESRMLNQFPGTLGQSLEFLRTQFFEDQPTVTQLIETEEDEEQPSHIFESIMQIMLCYVKFGEIKYGEESLSDERIQTIFDLIPELDSALLNSSGKERWTTVSTVLVRCWDYIESYIDRIKEQIEAEKEDGNESSASGVLSKRLGSMAGSSEEGSGDSTPVPGAGSVPGKASNAAGRAATRALAANTSGNRAGNLFVCGYCGRKLQKAPAIDTHLFCLKASSQNKAECAAIHESLEVLQDKTLSVVQAIARILLDKSKFVKKYDVTEQAQLERLIADMERKRRQIANGKSSLYEEYRNGHISRERFIKIQSDNKAEDERLQQKIAEKNVLLNECIQKQKALALAGRDAEQIQALTEYRPEVISRLIDKVRVFESGRIEIGLKSKYLTDIIGECIPELAS